MNKQSIFCGIVTICEKVEAGTITTRGHVRTAEQVADVLMKPLSPSRISCLCDKLGMITKYAPARGGVLEYYYILEY